jgi:hypothetical protein
VRQEDEYRLGDLFRLPQIIGMAQRYGMDQPDVPPHQLAERILGTGPGKLSKQVTVGKVRNRSHSTVICPPLREGDNYFI